jgi:hypothetical protein
VPIKDGFENVDFPQGAVKLKPDFLILNGCLHYSSDILSLFESLLPVCSRSTGIIIIYYSSLWRPIVSAATRLGFRQKTQEQNWLTNNDIDNLLNLSGLRTIRRSSHILLPVYIPIISSFLNRFISQLPFFRLFNMVNIRIARIIPLAQKDPLPSVSVVVPARNEAGTISQIVQRIPKMGPDDEIIFVEGNSTDNTWEVIENTAQASAQSKKIRCIRQNGKGKGDAVRCGFSIASREILMILDADLSVMPEDLPKFYKAMTEHKGDFINGSRLIYPMESGAMRFMNMIGNRFFAEAFSFLTGQKFKDTLCGTKVLYKSDYENIALGRKYFGTFDPYGDFDLIFGACRQALKIVEVPVKYMERTYGTTNIKRWRHGLILLRMLLHAAWKIKFL